jgi:CRP-like cAMP-binding protein/cytochrome P450
MTSHFAADPPSAKSQHPPPANPPAEAPTLTGLENGLQNTLERPPAPCPLHEHRLATGKPLGGRFAPLVSWLGRILGSVARQSEIHEDQRPPLLQSTPWFGPVASTRHYPFDLLSEGANQCGPIYRFELFGKTTNIVSGPEALRLAKQSEDLGLDRKSIFEPFVRVTGVPIFSAEGKEHELLRRLVRYGYTRGTIAPFVGHISETVQGMIADWPADLVLQPQMAEVAIKAMASAVSPEPIPINWPEMGEVGEMGMMVTVRQRPRFVLGLPKMRRSKRKTTAAIDPIIKKHRAGLTKDDPLPWMIDAFIAAQVDDKRLDDAAIRGGIVYALIAAYVYLGRQALFMLVEAVRDPQTLAAVNKEVDTAFSLGPLNAETLRQMPTLRALFVESNRRYPLLPGMPYETTRTVQVGDFKIGPNELIVLTAVPGHFDGQHYSCPWSFDQTRVRPPRNEHRANGAFAPWGFPPRSCLAIGLCELMTTTMVANILHTFEVTIPNKSESIPITVAPLVGPSDGQPVRLRRRAESERTIDPSALYEEKLHLSEGEEDLELPEFVSRSFQTGDNIFAQGDPAEEFFIILHGHVTVSENSSDSEEWQVNVYGPGQGFGEFGLLKQTPRNATARAMEPLDLLVIDRKTFLDLVAKLDEDAMHLALLIKNQFVARSLRRSLEGLVEGDVPKLKDLPFDRVDQGQWILREGDPADFAYIIVSGKVEVFCRKGEDEVSLTTLSVGDIFGEIGVLEKRPRTASVQATERTVVARLTPEMLQGMLDQSKDAASGMKLLIARRLMRSVEKLRQ